MKRTYNPSKRKRRRKLGFRVLRKQKQYKNKRNNSLLRKIK
ncbi:50S ribosomal protein L34 [Candidatus Karelsulcia muelleri]